MKDIVQLCSFLCLCINLQLICCLLSWIYSKFILSINNCQYYSNQGFWYFAEKKAKFHGIFRGKFAEKSAHFAGFSREESQNSRKNRPISGIFAGKKSKFVENLVDFTGFLRKNVKFRRIFRGKFLEKSADFTGNFEGKQKQPISLDFWGEISLKSINFASIWPALVNVFFNQDNHLLFQQQFTREMSEC